MCIRDRPRSSRTASARPPAKATVAQTIRQAAVHLGLPTQGRFAEPFWGGHALRRGGALYLGAAGVE
eukprot:10444961-Alexandrium_andersonii.AAC.1